MPWTATPNPIWDAYRTPPSERLTPLGTPVRVGDIATVSSSVKPVYTIVTANTKPAVLINVFRQPDSNTVAVANAVHAEIEAIRPIAGPLLGP